MVRKFALLGGLVLLAAAPYAASAAPPLPQSKPVAEEALVQQVQRRYCRDVRRECADRYGWGGWRYRRCVERAGC